MFKIIQNVKNVKKWLGEEVSQEPSDGAACARSCDSGWNTVAKGPRQAGIPKGLCRASGPLRLGFILRAKEEVIENFKICIYV